jgi:hypothetical protein
VINGDAAAHRIPADGLGERIGWRWQQRLQKCRLLDRQAESARRQRLLSDLAIGGEVVEAAIAPLSAKLRKNRRAAQEKDDPADNAAGDRTQEVNQLFGNDEYANNHGMKDARAQQLPPEAGWAGLPDPANAEAQQPLPRGRAEDTFAESKVGEHDDDGEPVQLERVDLAVINTRKAQAQKLKRYDEESDRDAIEEIGPDERARPGWMPPAGEQINESVAQVVQGLPPAVAIAREPFHHDGFEAARNLRSFLADRRRIFRDGLRKRSGDAFVVVGCLTAEKVIQGGANRVDVGTVIEGFAADLLRRREEHRAEKRAALGELVVARAGERLRQAEIADLDPIVGGEKAVGRLHVAVNHAEAVSLRQPVDDVKYSRDGDIGRKRTALVDEVLQCLAGHQFHHDIWAAGIGIGGEDKDATRMRDLTCQPTFLAEAFDRRRARRQSRRQQLDSDVLSGTGSLGLVDRTHTARAEQPEEPIAADRLRRRFRSDRYVVVTNLGGLVGAGPHQGRVWLMTEFVTAIHAERRRIPAVVG